MKRGLDWYKREPAAVVDAIRAARMTDSQAAVYNLVLDLLYMTGGEQPNDPRYIAAHFSNVGPAKARKTIDELVGMGKLSLVGDMLHQKRAENEAKTRRERSEKCAVSGRLGGIQSGVSRRNSNEINDTHEANASSETSAEKREIREEKRVVPPLTPPALVPIGKAAPSALVSEFERVWPYYPRRVGVGQARKAWVRARAKAGFEEIAAPLREFIRATKDTPIDKVPHFATWLNGERWRDNQAHAANRSPTSSDDLRALSTISATDDLARLMGPQIKAIGR
jgi:uncharacterized protein YdaU (DUF1376 family)